jgi:hypothetical protein
MDNRTDYIILDNATNCILNGLEGLVLILVLKMGSKLLSISYIYCIKRVSLARHKGYDIYTYDL